MEELYRPTVRNQADLEEVWVRLMGPWGLGRRSIWMIRLDPSGNLVPAITEIAECDDVPEPDSASGLAEILSTLDADDPGGTFAFLISRPGRSRIDADDLAWGRLLLEAGRLAGVDLQMLHLATDEGTVPLPPDALAARRTA